MVIHGRRRTYRHWTGFAVLPTRISSPALLEALERVTEIRALGVSGLDLSRFPAGRIKTIARNTATAWAQTLARLQPPRRIASLLVFAHVYEAVSQDDALELFSQLIIHASRVLRKRGKRSACGLSATWTRQPFVSRMSSRS